MRAQTTAEFIVLAAVLVLFFAALMDTYFYRLAAGQDYTERLNAQRIADDAARHVNRVLQAGNSSRAQLMLPSSLRSGQNYAIEILERRVVVEWDGTSASALLLSSSVSGSLAAGSLNNITNVDGGVVIGPA